jgi:hypothetical protein
VWCKTVFCVDVEIVERCGTHAVIGAWRGLLSEGAEAGGIDCFFVALCN